MAELLPRRVLSIGLACRAFANMTFEELKAELLAGIVGLFPEPFELSLRSHRR